ncbi:Uncharacterised protein [Burkholderia pseudomallei]|nr:Uncharacterised protein [Burkholderia pseudomallei]CAJ2791794.1 Uncharacterised protein [Burkholderia pseudomallei]CAJ2795629.1 Uncharacterised protein [Burkholderia pseudomallei]CAJ2866340.1 Uncharacterised protein [Burkholderia pseudomallei]CAJ3421165.1 Uncharacterised protein [Burkholderia pseudomallei]
MALDVYHPHPLAAKSSGILEGNYSANHYGAQTSTRAGAKAAV